MTKPLKILLKEPNLNSAQNANFGSREYLDAPVWPVDVELNFVMNAVEQVVPMADVQVLGEMEVEVVGKVQEVRELRLLELWEGSLVEEGEIKLSFKK